MENLGTYDVEKLNKVKDEITKKNDKLLSEIVVALNHGDTSTYNHLKTLQMECAAQMRFIGLLENNFDDSNYIIC